MYIIKRPESSPTLFHIHEYRVLTIIFDLVRSVSYYTKYYCIHKYTIQSGPLATAFTLAYTWHIYVLIFSLQSVQLKTIISKYLGDGTNQKPKTALRNRRGVLWHYVNFLILCIVNWKRCIPHIVLTFSNIIFPLSWFMLLINFHKLYNAKCNDFNEFSLLADGRVQESFGFLSILLSDRSFILA